MKKITKAIIPAAGLGTRFLPATIAQPKEMLPIVDKPVIQFVVEEAVAAGIRDILIITGRNKRSIEDHFDPSFELEEALLKKQKNDLLQELNYISNLANIHFTRQRRQIGIADAIYQGRIFVGDDPFAVLLGDTIIHSNGDDHNLSKMAAAFRANGKSIVAVEKVKKELTCRYGIVAGQDQKQKLFLVEKLVEKPAITDAPSDLAIASRYIFTPEIFDLIKKTEPGVGGEVQITDTMKYLADLRQLLAFRISGRSYDVGNKVDFVKTNIDFALRHKDTKEEIKQYIKKISRE
jgi:UTP--glucose-1-phosphate uridylyltransferase